MTKTLPWTGRFALFLFLPAGILPFFYSSDQHSRVTRALPNDPQAPIARPGAPLGAAELRSPRISDWSTRHVVYTQFGTSRALEAASRDPRASCIGAKWNSETASAINRSRPAVISNSVCAIQSVVFRCALPRAACSADWNISLGATAARQQQYPAKYTFDQTATPTAPMISSSFPIAQTVGHSSEHRGFEQSL